jgi:prepilin-type N-terminal cleavage/methylation domain-containing protein
MQMFIEEGSAMKTKITRKSAFTLIELLVVIAIIALLLSILIPSLNMAKRKASMVVDMTNAKNISLAWFSYKEDNKSKIPSSLPVNIGLTGSSEAWIGNPVDAAEGFPSVVQLSPPVTDADEIRGIERGVLFAYLNLLAGVVNTH